MVHFKRKADIPEVSVTISFRTFVRLTLLTVATILLFGALHKASHAILLIFISFFLALALNSPVYWLSEHLPGKRKGSRSLATTLSFLIVVVALAAFIASLAPSLVRQTENFVSAAPKLVRDFQDQNSTVGRFIREHQLEDDIDNVSGQLQTRLKSSSGSAFSTIQKVGSSVFALLTILVLTFMMLVEGPRWLKFFHNVVPVRHQKAYDRLTSDMYGVVKGYVNGQLFLAVLASLFIIPMLFILGIDYPVALMVVVLICGLIPMVGHTIGATIVTIVALFTSVNAAIIILAYYILYQQLENYLIQPRVQANTTNMSPLLVFMSLIVGVSFGGLVGGLVAIPVAGCLRIAVLEYLRAHKIIQEPDFKKLTTETK
jgi:predicted PurR-regulated permease PerM